MEILDSLNPEQQEAVTKTDGYLLVLAGAGSGKTRVLTYKIAWLIEHKKVKSWDILAVTFTNKAAAEMKDRIEKLIGEVAKQVWMGTFHSFCARLLRRYGELLGYSRNFTIYDADDSKNLIKKIIKDKGLEIKIPPKGIAGKISKAKNNFILPDKYPIYDFQSNRIKEIYKLYQEALKSNNAMDFDDLLLNACKVFQESKEALGRFSFKYILVDEYQDTNKVQYELLKLLSKKYGNLTVVGDEDQSIYGFRGADIGNILHFEKDFPQIHIVRLEENYRSTQTILKAASAVVSNNKFRIGKELWTNNETGNKLSLYTARNANEEARKVVEVIKKYKRPLKDFTVLYRTNAQSRVIEEALRRENMPYIIVGGIRFYERKEIKDILAYLRVLMNPDDNISLARIINTPLRGIGPKTRRFLEDYAKKERVPIYFALKKVNKIKKIILRKQKVLKKFFKLMENHRCKLGKPAKLIENILNETGYLDMLREEEAIEAESRIENLNELIAGAGEYETLEDFIESVSLLTNIDEWDETQTRVTLMTTHNAKGLEFPIVFIAGLEEGLFPHSSSFYDEAELEEERRLFHVGLTRAKERVYLSYAQSRRGYSFCLPSRFIDEIPADTLEMSEELLPADFIEKMHADSHPAHRMGGTHRFNRR
ncbi:UvrD-helicase domain-containing protein [candidate division WOR-3 bacterium]|nr:UvrD-helicase domain-containing protein [candidate division WOR-3 bacterium]